MDVLEAEPEEAADAVDDEAVADEALATAATEFFEACGSPTPRPTPKPMTMANAMSSPIPAMRMNVPAAIPQIIRLCGRFSG